MVTMTYLVCFNLFFCAIINLLKGEIDLSTLSLNTKELKDAYLRM